MSASRLRICGVGEKAVSFIPSGWNTRSAMTSPNRRPVIASTTRPAQSMLEPYSHCSPGSNSSGVRRASCEQVSTLGCPCSCARRVYVSLKKS